ncbi:follicle cell protein 3C [Cochliomyia hominivorax]
MASRILVYFYNFAIINLILSCCISCALAKIAYKKPINVKEKSYGKVDKDVSLDLLTSDITTISLISKEDEEDLIATTTPFSKDTPLASYSDSYETTSKEASTTTANIIKATFTKTPQQEDLSCTCGIFLSSQFVKGSAEPPKGDPAISTTLERSFQCNAIGQKQCQTKCLEQIVQHLPNSANILCASLDRDIRKERAYLFVRNCNSKWYNTNLAAGREYCCKNGLPYSCSKK